MFKNFLRKDEIVKCEQCKCLLYKHDAQEVKRRYIFNLFCPDDVSYLYYCPEHNKPYDIVSQWNSSVKYYRKNVRVDKKGKPTK